MTKERLYQIVFKADTRLGKLFDIVLIVLIFVSVLLVMLESVPPIQLKFGRLFYILEWIITIIFTLEYVLRIYIVSKPKNFIFSFFGIIDLLSILPTYIALLLMGTQGLMVIRALRLLRIFRVLKLNKYVDEGNFLIRALKASRFKVSIFSYTVLILIIVIGAIMYLIEGKTNGFDSIPRSMYWVVVTITTVGFGDIVPQTALGKFVASFIMLLGYAIIAVPTGIVTAEISQAKKEEKKKEQSSCNKCNTKEHDNDALFCKKCGKKLT